MQTTSRIIMGMALLSLLYSCKKDDPSDGLPTPPPAALDISSFSLLDSGNYWVYERHQVDSVDADMGVSLGIDSLFVTGDTTIDGVSYAVIRRASNGVTNPLQTQYWRDSADFIVTSTHQILLSASTFDQVIYTEITDYLHIDYSEGSELVPVPVPARTFDSYLVKGSVTTLGGLPMISDWRSPKYYWAADVGRVRWYTYYVFGSYGLRYDLVRFHV